MARTWRQSSALIGISKILGWDATRIWDHEKKSYGESIEGWDHPFEVFDSNMGPVPDGVPAVKGSKDPTEEPKYSEKITFDYPDVSRESRVSGNPKLTLSDPFEGKPGAR